MVPTPYFKYRKSEGHQYGVAHSKNGFPWKKFGEKISKAVLAMTAIRLRGVKINEAVNASFFELRDRIFLRNFRYLRSSYQTLRRVEAVYCCH